MPVPHAPLVGTSEWIAQAPAPRLAGLVDRYIGYRLAGFPPGVHHGLPSRHMTFIVSIGNEIEVAVQTDRAQSPGHYGCVLSGLQASSALIAHDGNQEGVAVQLNPAGCRALFGMPARALWNTSVELSDVTGPVGRELWERLQEVSSWAERFAVCDEVLSRLLREVQVAPELLRCWDLLVRTDGAIAVTDLAAEVAWTRQHLARRFGDEFGLSPKLAARVVRFDRARHMLHAATRGVSIATVAATCGYYDQAHMTRDFVDLAGCPPARLLAEDLPSFQDPPEDEGRP